jgi:hypothetical protein
MSGRVDWEPTVKDFVRWKRSYPSYARYVALYRPPSTVNFTEASPFLLEALDEAYARAFAAGLSYIAPAASRTCSELLGGG